MKSLSQHLNESLNEAKFNYSKSVGLWADDPDMHIKYAAIYKKAAAKIERGKTYKVRYTVPLFGKKEVFVTCTHIHSNDIKIINVAVAQNHVNTKYENKFIFVRNAGLIAVFAGSDMNSDDAKQLKNLVTDEMYNEVVQIYNNYN